MSELKPEDQKIVDEIGPVLDAIAIKSLTHVKRLSDLLYEQLLDGVQDYLTENGRWNLDVKLAQYQRTYAENRVLEQRVTALREALEMLERQAIQSPDLRATEWGQEALSAARAALQNDGGRDA